MTKKKQPAIEPPEIDYDEGAIRRASLRRATRNTGNVRIIMQDGRKVAGTSVAQDNARQVLGSLRASNEPALQESKRLGWKRNAGYEPDYGD